MGKGLRRCIVRLMADRKANTATIFALAAIPLLGAVGLGLDYGRAFLNRTTLDSAADAASLAAVEAVQSALNANPPASLGAALARGRTQGAAAFNANAGQATFGSPPKPKVTVTSAKGAVTATVAYSDTVATTVGHVLGVSAIHVSGSATATQKLAEYVRLYVLLDNSESMGIGATPADMTNLYNRVQAAGGLTEGGCVFGCHLPTEQQTQSNEWLAHNVAPPITLRLDAAVAAIKAIIAQAQKAQTSSSDNLVQIGLYTVDENLVSLAQPSADFTALTAAVNQVTLGDPTSTSLGDSDFPATLDSFASLLPNSGDGSSAANAVNYVLLITDGVQDILSSSCNNKWLRCTGLIDQSLCQALKSKATLGVLYTTYDPIYAKNTPPTFTNRYSNLVYPFAAQLAPNLQACATSPAWFYEAPDGPSITTGLQKLYQQATQIVRLTQ